MNDAKIIKIRINLEEKDSLYEKFNALKKKTALNANTEVIRYVIKKAYDVEFSQEE
jgi:hypothetical protein